jgi:thiol:disulfide interchange protein
MAHRLHHLIAATLLALLPLNAPAGERWARDGGLGAILKPDEAFRLMPAEVRGKTLRVEWEIAPGYYMYLQRLKFESADGAAALGAAKLPAGEKHHDEHFGDVLIQRAGRLVAEIPVNVPPKSLKLTYQGCAEVGVCLPPQYRTVAVSVLP